MFGLNSDGVLVFCLWMEVNNGVWELRFESGMKCENPTLAVRKCPTNNHRVVGCFCCRLMLECMWLRVSIRNDSSKSVLACMVSWRFGISIKLGLVGIITFAWIGSKLGR